MRIRALLLVLVLLALPAAATAVEKPKKSGGVTITPAMQEVEIKDSLIKQSGTFTVRNNSDQPAAFELSAIDMGALDETGGLIFSGLPQDYLKKYGLAEWVELPRKRIEIATAKTETVSFNIRNSENLSPGGHYGAIIVKQVPRQAAQPVRQVTISPQAASLLFLLKRGGEVYKLSLPGFRANTSVWNLPTKVELPFKNEGNVHVVPRGIVRLKNTLGNEIAKAVINPESSYVLPERSRALHVAFDNLPKNIWPGRYTIEVDYRYDGQENFTRVSQTFYTANLRVLLALVSILLLSGVCLYRFRRSLGGLIRISVRATRRAFAKLFKKQTR